jgi:hypothetical protein
MCAFRPVLCFRPLVTCSLWAASSFRTRREGVCGLCQYSFQEDVPSRIPRPILQNQKRVL